jgi:hypothetical protein
MHDFQLLERDFQPRTQCSLIGSILGAVGSLAGGLIDRDTSLKGQSRQAAHTERMYKHRYQWQMEDMAKAGLNPILAYRQSPPGPTGIGGASSNIASAAATGVSSAVALRRVKAEIDNIRADTAMKSANERLADEQRTVATSQHQLNDVIARGNVLSNMSREPDAWSAQELMRIMREGGRAGDLAGALNRLRIMLGIGGGR